MRNICFVRHAKSSWEYPELADIDRPLNERGRRDAPFMARKMHELGIAPDLILTSPANRAKTTAEHFLTEFKLGPTAFRVVEDLYIANADDIVAIVRKVEPEFESVFVFGHNPTMTILANTFPGVDGIDNVPTCGIFQAKTLVDSWQKWSPDVSAFIGFYYPKLYL